jgi:hypothetical protein
MNDRQPAFNKPPRQFHSQSVHIALPKARKALVTGLIHHCPEGKLKVSFGKLTEDA